MVSNQVLGVRIVAGLVILSVAVSGCSSVHHRSDRGASAEDTAGAPVDTGAPSQDLTATEAAVKDAPPVTSPPVSEPGPADASNILNPSAPKSYVVKPGDTLWGIASLFLRDPWLWPEVWYINPQVSNPHLIYPGDTLALAYGANGKLEIRLVQKGAARTEAEARVEPRLRSSGAGAIPTIPYSAISAFLSRPTVLTPQQVKAAPYVVALRDDHEIGGTGHEVYVTDLKAAEHSRFSVMHVGRALRDPDDGKVLGFEGIYTATALVSKPGRPSKALLIDSARETLRGDKLLSTDNDAPLNFALRAPRGNVRGRIISVIDGTNMIGQYQIVIINRGKRAGLDAGSILAIDQAGEVVRDIYAGSHSVAGKLGFGTSFAPKVRLPEERAGTLLVFKAYDRLSYGLIVGAVNAIHVADIVRNP